MNSGTANPFPTIMNNLSHLSFLFIILLLAASHSDLAAQDRDDYDERRSRIGLEYRMFRVALVPGLSTNGIDADEYASRYSLNILGGYNGALERGFELGGLANINKYYVHGVQLAGLANISGEETSGVQLSGIFNYSGEEMQGIQLSGAANISKDDMQGIQITGAVNWSEGNAQGIQLSGAANIAHGDMQGLYLTGALNYAADNLQGIMMGGAVNYAGGDMQGIMLSGALNYSDMFQGIALGGINVAKEFQGIQAGAINVTGYGQGIQVGVINYGRRLEGLPVGLISYYEDGRTDMDIWTSDGGFVNYGLKLGTEDIYNMISVGYNPALSRDVWQVGWSIGSLREYKNHFQYSDLSIFKINEGGWTDELNSLIKYRLLFGKDFGRGIQVYGGPTLNLLISRVEGSSDYTWYTLYSFGAKGRDYRFWIGYSIGFELL